MPHLGACCRYGATIASSEKAALAEAQKLVDESKLKVAALEARLAALAAEKPLDEITVSSPSKDLHFMQEQC